jgi:hypothetical protein
VCSVSSQSLDKHVETVMLKGKLGVSCVGGLRNHSAATVGHRQLNFRVGNVDV